MPFSLDEHELRLEGLPRQHLEFDTELTEAEIGISIIEYERAIRESCVYDPGFNEKIMDLCANYSLEDLEIACSMSSSDVFAARNDLERFIAVNANSNGELPQELQKQLADYRTILENAIIRNEMLKSAIGLKNQTRIEPV